MGAFSEIDLSKSCENDPFGELCESLAFAEDIPFSSFAENIAEVAAPAVKTDQPPKSATQSSARPAPVQNNKAAVVESKGSADKAAKAAAAKAEEDAKRKAHEDSEAKRKAEWEARQQRKKEAEKEQLDRLAAMSDEEVLAESLQRVSTDTERLTRRNMKECVAEHIQTLCLGDPSFARKVSHPRKNMVHCFQYIERKAWEHIQPELKANSIQLGPNRPAYGCDIPDGLCYQWAEAYFNDPDAKEDHEDEEKFEPKPYYGAPTATGKSASKKKAEDKPSPPPKKAAVKTPSEDSGQISFGGFTMPEEMAG